MNERLRELRTAMGLTLAQFGEALGMSIGGVADIERGKNPLKERHIKAICSVFPRVSEDWLRTGTGDMFRGDDLAQLEQRMAALDFDAVVREAVTVYHGLPIETQRAINDYVRTLVARLAAQSDPVRSSPVQSGPVRSSPVQSGPTDEEMLAAFKEEAANEKGAQSDRSADGDTVTAG